MKKIIAVVTFVMFGLLCSNSFAQGCYDFHKKKCQALPSSGYTVSPESRSAIMRKGQESRIKYIINAGKDYRFSVCLDEEHLGSKIQMQIVDYETNTKLYDNAEFNYVKDFEISVLEGRMIYIVVAIPDDQSAKTPSSTSGFVAKTVNQGCVGIMIEEMVTPKTGF